MAGVEQRIFFKKISANGGVDFALKRCYSRGTSESNTDFLDFICLSQTEVGFVLRSVSHDRTCE